MILMFYLKRYMQLILLYQITKAPILTISMQHLTTCGASEQQCDSCSLLDWPVADVYFPIAKSQYTVLYCVYWDNCNVFSLIKTLLYIF